MGSFFSSMGDAGCDIYITSGWSHSRTEHATRVIICFLYTSSFSYHTHPHPHPRHILILDTSSTHPSIHPRTHLNIHPPPIHSLHNSTSTCIISPLAPSALVRTFFQTCSKMRGSLCHKRSSGPHRPHTSLPIAMGDNAASVVSALP